MRVDTGWRSVSRGRYGSVHNWLGKNYKKSGICEFCGFLDGRRSEWALKKGCEYEFKRENFMELCVSCHRKYDDSIKQAQATVRRPVVAIIDGQEKIYASALEAWRQTGILNTSIRNCISGRSKTAGGHRWKYAKS